MQDDVQRMPSAECRTTNANESMVMYVLQCAFILLLLIFVVIVVVVDTESDSDSGVCIS